MDPMDSQKCKLGRKGFDKLLCPSYYTYRMFNYLLKRTVCIIGRLEYFHMTLQEG